MESGAMHDYKRLVRKTNAAKRPKRQILRSRAVRSPSFRNTSRRTKHGKWPR